MTLAWTLTKMAVGFGLGTISDINPATLAIGLPTSQLIKLKSKENLNSSNLNLFNKETAQRLIELSTDYQVGAGFGIAFKGAGAIANEIAKETLKIGKQAGKEIAIHGFQTELAKNLIKKGEFFSNVEKIIRLLPTLYEEGEPLNDILKILINDLTRHSEDEFINSANALINSHNLIINKIDELTNENRNLFNLIRKSILDLNEKNIEFLIKYQLNKETHSIINQKINKTLKRIKAIQLRFHKSNQLNCCNECRFC